MNKRPSHEEWNTTLIAAITDAIFVHEVRPDGTSGKFIEVNEVACERLGYTRQELLQLTPKDIDAPDGTDSTDIIKVLATGQNITFEQIHVTKDGRRIPVEIAANAFTLAGKPAVLSMVRDISERKQAETEIKAHCCLSH